MSTEPAPEIVPPQLPPPVKAAPAAPRLVKNPWVAAVLSLFPGLGQVYNGQAAKALVFFFAWVGSIYATITVNPLPFAFLIPFAYLYGIVDAFRSAAVVNARIAGGAAEEKEETVESPAWGIALVVVGLVLLFNNLGWLRLEAIAQYWPVLLIVAGGAFVWNSARRRKEEQKGDGGLSL